MSNRFRAGFWWTIALFIPHPSIGPPGRLRTVQYYPPCIRMMAVGGLLFGCSTTRYCRTTSPASYCGRMIPSFLSMYDVGLIARCLFSCNLWIMIIWEETIDSSSVRPYSCSTSFILGNSIYHGRPRAPAPPRVFQGLFKYCTYSTYVRHRPSRKHTHTHSSNECCRIMM